MFRWSTLVLLSTDVVANAESLDEDCLLQMPSIGNELEAEEDASDCRCPAYFQEQCEAEAAQGCVWSDDGDSNGHWCQCGPIPETLPAPPPTAPLPAPEPQPQPVPAPAPPVPVPAPSPVNPEPPPPAPPPPVPAPPPVNPGTAVVALNWDGGSLAIPEGEEGCLSPVSAGYPNDGLTGITDLRAGCEVEFFQHGGCTGAITVVTDERSDLHSLGISGVIVTCSPGLATLHWNGGSIRLPQGHEGCLGPMQPVGHQGGYPNDMLTGVTDVKSGCEVKVYQHEGCTGTVTSFTDDSRDLYSLGISGVIVSCGE